MNLRVLSDAPSDKFGGILSDGHDRMMIEFCSINSPLDHLDHRGLSIMGTARSCSTIIEYTRASWFMTDHSTNLSDWVMR